MTISRPRLGRPAILGLPLLAGLSLFMAACSGIGHSSGTEPGDNDAHSTEVAEQREIMRGFLEAYPVKSYTSFEEAEQVAGYHIPRASSEYPVGYGLTHLQWFPELERPFSETQYTYPPLAPTSIGVTVTPSYFYQGGDTGATDGEPMTVGGKTGWMNEDQTAWVFIFGCGSVDHVNVWCQVTGVKEIGWEAFEHFVSTLQ
jgi:hypothetical protein